MSHSPQSSPSSPAPVADDSTPATQIPLPRTPPTPPPDSDPSPRINSNAAEFPAILTASSSPSQSTLTSFPSQGHPTFASVVASPSVPSLPTSVSSPAWFPPFDPTSPESPLVPSSSSATLVDCLSPSASPQSKSIPALSSLELVHEIKQSTLEEGEIALQLSEAEVFMKDLGLKDTANGSKETEPGQIIADSPVLPAQPHCSPSPPRAPSRPTIPLPPVDSDPLHFSVPRQREESAPARVSKNNESSAPAPAEPEKTPNVYINGLPPNFPEDQLFDLAAPFGDVRSVRSFTRHVGDAETGYGFVLFETIASAEKCINSLRRYRNLHPTFSKVHKIPGTMYSQPQPASDHGASATPSASSLAGWEQESAGDGSADSTFKAKMERLSDKQSTNLYIEGLPLSIDEATLAALVSPYSIRSSRFFQTKLSSPPRIIAFVRLETRIAAEEIIERLHGRMVRGWNDPGSRISVRFADTSEQRELRRQERLAREGDQASNQLSIAQATLLNLRGKELHTRAPIAAGTRLGDYSDGCSDFQSNASQLQTSAYPGSDFEVDYSRVPARYPHTLPAQQQPLNHFGQQNVPAQSVSQRMNPAMASLLDSLQTSGAAFRGRDVYAQDALDYRTLQQQQLASLSNVHNGRSYIQQGLGLAPAQTHVHPGYTATEEFILRARSNSVPQKRRPLPLDLNQARHQQHHEMESAAANINMGVRGYRAQASTLSFPHQQQHAAMFDPHDSMNEEEFHAASSIPHQTQAQTHRPFDNGERIMNQLHAHSLHTQQTPNARIPRNQSQQHLQHHFLASSSRAPSQIHDFSLRNQQSLAANQQTHHYQHSLPTTSNAQHARNMTTLRPGAQANNMMNNNTNSLGNSPGIYERSTRDVGQRRGHNGSSSYHGPSNMYSSSSDVDQSSPPLVSPALTYSSRSSVAFSPTTPFFGTFEEDETFRAPQMDAKGKKINSRTATR